MMKKLFFLLSLVLSIHAFGQPGKQKRALYEFDYDIPVYYDSIHAMLTYPLAWRNCRQTLSFDQWREKARQRVLELMGPQPPRTTDWNMKVLAEEQRDGYRARKIEFSLSRWYRVRALLLIPDGGGKHPAVNLLHDHGAHLYIGKEKMIRPLDEDTAVVNDADRWCRMLYENQYLGDYLARHGYVVFSADAPLWGDRGRKEGVDRAKYDIIAGNMMELGRNLCAQMHYDDIAGTDFLASLPCVDADRIGAAGCSMGAYRTWMLAALTDKVKVGCADCWMVTTEAQLTKRYGRAENGGFANCIPGLRNYLDYPDIASIACPKPMLFINGTRDKLFPVPGVKKAFEIMQHVWQDQGKADQLETYIWDQPHECNLKDQKAILDFLDRYLKDRR